MDKEEIKKILEELLEEKALSSLNVPFHRHTQTDAGQLDASKALVNSPQATIASVTGTLSTGGPSGLTTGDSVIITNMQTALNSLITANKTIGLIKTS